MLEFQSADDRRGQYKKLNMLLCGPPGIGKTYSARTLPAAETLFIDCEAGTRSIEAGKNVDAWAGRTLDMRRMSQKFQMHPWEICKGIASLLYGPDYENPSGSYGPGNYNHYLNVLASGNQNLFDGINILFIDSATVASRWALEWSFQQPECFSEKTGKLDKRGGYGLMAQEFIKWIEMLQHQPRSVIMSCILENKEDEFKRKSWKLQVEGQQSADKIPGIFDVIGTIAWVDFGDHGRHRVIATQEGNEFGYPAKDRSNVLEAFELPDLGSIIKKNEQFQTNQGVTDHA